MACGSCGKGAHNEPGMFSKTARAAVDSVNIGKNLLNAVRQQPDKIKWFKNGLTGIIKCLEHKTIYTDEQIQEHRNVCKECPHSTKKDGKLTSSSQCMYPDPVNNGAPCACNLMCKTQSDVCPAKNWPLTNLTINRQ